VAPLLIVDTASRPGFLGLWTSQQWLGRKPFPDGRRQGEEFFPLLEELLADSGLTLNQLLAIVVAKGPGSFSALRVGLCAAKSLAESGKLPLAGVSLLDAAACFLPGQSRVVFLTASRGEAFIGHYGGDNRPAAAPVVSSARHWQRPGSFEPEALLAGDEELAQVAADNPQLGTLPVFLVGNHLPDLLAEEGARRVRDHRFDDALLLDALYVRGNDADGAWTDVSAD